MPPLSPARRQANLRRRIELIGNIRRYLNKYKVPSEPGGFGFAPSWNEINIFKKQVRELAARRMQAAARRRQATPRTPTPRNRSRQRVN